VTVGAVVQSVGEALARGHALFGEPVDGDAQAASSADHLTDGAALTASGRRSMSSSSGRLPAGYDLFAAAVGNRLDAFAGADDQLRSQVRDTAAADRLGRNASGQVVDGAAADTARMAPGTVTPAGQRALINALRARVSQQQQVVAAYRARAAQMAAALRTLSYPLGAGIGGGGSPLGGGLPLGGMAGGSPALGGSWPRRGSSQRSALPIRLVDNRAVPTGPAGSAVAAALSKRGRPYRWGAKGPNVFDCSGLTQWAWRQAGVQLGGDTYAQIRDGIPVPPDQVRAGDLIFPKSSFDRHGPGHVMLAISPTQVVHAPHTGDVVRVAPMPSGFVARRPVPLTRL
jgi:cell wall-associated NlpC family hydrolase